MKNFKNYFFAMAAFALLFTSCSKDDSAEVTTPNGDVATLSLGAVLNGLDSDLKQAVPECSEDAPMYARVILTYGEANTEIDVVVPLIIDDSGIYTDYDDELEIPIPNEGDKTTEVFLTDFWVYAEEPGETTMPIWIAPTEGSDYENFVNDALPMSFDLRAGSKKYVDVEVLCFEDRDVNLYGYQFFDLIPVPLMKFCLFGNFCPPESSRHYVAGYTVSVWEGDQPEGEPLYNEISNDVIEDDATGDYYSDPLCVWLPDREGTDTYYFEISIASTDEYDAGDAEGDIILEGSITDDEIRMFYGEEGVMDYYHFNYGCGNDNPPPFNEPDDVLHYKACLKAEDGSTAYGFSYLSLDGNSLTAKTWVPFMDSNETVPQHIHVNDDCDNAGGVLWPLDNGEGVYPTSDGNGELYYSHTFTLSADELSDLLDGGTLDERTVNLHENVDGLPVISCGEYESY